MSGKWFGVRLAAALAMMLIAQAMAPENAQAKGKAAKKITPGHVFARVELIKHKLDAIIEHRKITELPVISLRETGLKPMHIYQMHLLCLDQLRSFEKTQGLVATPLILASPSEYGPGDVYLLTSLLSERVDRLADALGVSSLPDEESPIGKKNPTHVFSEIVPVLSRLLALNETLTVTPDEVFSQMVRARQDMQSIISTVAMQNTGAKRRQLQAKAFGMSVDGKHLEIDQSIKRTPADAFAACLEIRQSVNQLWTSLDRKTLPEPIVRPDDKIGPADVYLQTQIIIAELNLLKLVTKTTAATPPADQAEGRTPSHVHGEATWTNFILRSLVDHFAGSQETASKTESGQQT